jgi:penicillin-binding protein 1A
VGIAWIGYDQPRNLGNKETGGGLALPIWIGFMQKALKNEPVVERPAPPGLVQYGDEFYYAENPPGTGVQSLDVGPVAPAAEQKSRDAVRNELF